MWITKLKKTMLAGLFLLAADAQAGQCTGRVTMPYDVDFGAMFPITIAGASIGGWYNSDSPLHYEPPECVCPSVIFDAPSPGIGITYWEPKYLVDMEWRPGCLQGMGGKAVLGTAYDSLSSNYSTKNQTAGHNEEKHPTRVQIHWIRYGMIWEMLTAGEMDMACKTSGGAAVAWMTEVDATWQDDLWSAIFTPESSFFANPILGIACAVDAIASAVGYPLEGMIWCQGTWGSLYPFTGNIPNSSSQFIANRAAAGRFIARNFRVGVQLQTIGPTAICYEHPNPVIIKGQWRFNQVQPIPRYGRAVVMGDPGILQFPPTANAPTQEASTDMIWEAKQCCYRTY